MADSIVTIASFYDFKYEIPARTNDIGFTVRKMIAVTQMITRFQIPPGAVARTRDMQTNC